MKNMEKCVKSNLVFLLKILDEFAVNDMQFGIDLWVFAVYHKLS